MTIAAGIENAISFLKWSWLNALAQTSEPRQHEKPDRRADDGG
jgi:hypothetical protein